MFAYVCLSSHVAPDRLTSWFKLTTIYSNIQSCDFVFHTLDATYHTADVNEENREACMTLITGLAA